MQTNTDPRILTDDLRQTLVEAINDEGVDADWDESYIDAVTQAIMDWPADKLVPVVDYTDLNEDDIVRGDWPDEAIINMTVDYFIGHWPGHPGV